MNDKIIIQLLFTIVNNLSKTIILIIKGAVNYVKINSTKCKKSADAPE